MRKVRDYNAELKALEDKARSLKARRVEQLGQLVTAATFSIWSLLWGGAGVWLYRRWTQPVPPDR
jgi:hypothetical protein